MVVVIDFVVAVLAFVVAVVVVSTAVVIAVLLVVAVAVVLSVAVWLGEIPHFDLYQLPTDRPAAIPATYTNTAMLHFRFQAAVETPSITSILLHAHMHIQTQTPYWIN